MTAEVLSGRTDHPCGGTIHATRNMPVNVRDRLMAWRAQTASTPSL